MTGGHRPAGVGPAGRSPAHGFCDDEETRRRLRSRPPRQALAWAAARLGPAVTDVAHCRVNLLTLGAGAAERFTAQCQQAAGDTRLTELLLADSVETEARAHTRTLGLDTEGDFVALAWPDGANPTAALPAGFLRLEAMGALFALGQFAREVGPLTLRCEKLPLGDSGGQVLVIYHAEPGSVTAQALAELGKRTEADGPTPPTAPPSAAARKERRLQPG